MASFPTLELTHGTFQRRAYNHFKLLELGEELVQDNVKYLLAHPEVPHPYQSRAVYKLERRGQERWQGVKKLLFTRRGDCEDWAAYLAAWYRARLGIHAEFVLWRLEQDGEVWYHAVVLLPDGTIEDPSKMMGM